MTRSHTTNEVLCVCTVLILVLHTAFSAMPYAGQNQLDQLCDKLLKAGMGLMEKKYYLEALDHLSEARDMIEKSAQTDTPQYADVLLALAETKIRGRLHQSFPAYYVKTALEDVQLANRLNERSSGVMPQKLAEGYFLEGYIQKNFFMRYDVAAQIFSRAVTVDPGFIAAKRELSELLAEEKQK